MPMVEGFTTLRQTAALKSGAHIVVAKQAGPPPGDVGELSSEEQLRLAKFVDSKSASAFLNRRLVLRQLLSAATDLPADRITYTTNAHGKLRVAPQTTRSVLFSVSQGDGLAAIAICHGSDVGLDLEHQSAAVAAPDVMPSLHADEVSSIHSAADPAKAFVRLWVRKEAIAKLDGSGFARAAHTWSCLDHAAHTQSFRFQEHWLCVATPGPTPFSCWVFDAAEPPSCD